MQRASMMIDPASERNWQFSIWLKLLLSGWWPGRDAWNRLTLPEGIDIFPAARRVLAEFGGLIIGDRVERVRLDPSAIEPGCLEEIKHYAEQLGERLYPVGVIEHQDPIYILIDEHGRVFTLSLFDRLLPYAMSFNLAIQHLTGGVNCRAQDDDLADAGLLGKQWQINQESQGGYRPPSDTQRG